MSKPKAQPIPKVAAPTPAPVPDDEATKRDGEKDYARARRRSGRASTLLSNRDTLG